jgi:hypothetical protein
LLQLLPVAGEILKLDGSHSYVIDRSLRCVLSVLKIRCATVERLSRCLENVHSHGLCVSLLIAT